jgi:hypothetical protein
MNSLYNLALFFGLENGSCLILLFLNQLIQQFMMIRTEMHAVFEFFKIRTTIFRRRRSRGRFKVDKFRRSELGLLVQGMRRRSLLGLLVISTGCCDQMA